MLVWHATIDGGGNDHASCKEILIITVPGWALHHAGAINMRQLVGTGEGIFFTIPPVWPRWGTKYEAERRKEGNCCMQVFINNHRHMQHSETSGFNTERRNLDNMDFNCAQGRTHREKILIMILPCWWSLDHQTAFVCKLWNGCISSWCTAQIRDIKRMAEWWNSNQEEEIQALHKWLISQREASHATLRPQSVQIS